MAANRQTNAFLTALLEMPQTMAEIAREVWGWVAKQWMRYVAVHSILWFLIIYFGVVSAVIGWRYSEGSAFLTWAFWEEARPSLGDTVDGGGPASGTEGIRNLVWSLATLAGGAAAGIGLILAARRTTAANQQAEAALKQSVTAFESLVTERFTRAVEQLGHEKRAVRLGAIYALERIAKDSARDRGTIVETLTAYIREHAPAEQGADKAGQTPPIDLDAAIKISTRL